MKNRVIVLKGLGFLLCGASAFSLGCAAAHAQDKTASDKGEKIEEVIVYGQKVGKNLQKSPLSITAVSGGALDQQNIASAKDLGTIAPGLVVNSTPSNPLSLTIRGAGYEGIQNNSAQPSVSFNENGVYISNPVGLGSNFLDVDQLEVLRGPQGTVLGQNSDGGALNITTVRPVLGKDEGSADLSLGSFGLDRVRLVENLPIGSDMALRAAVQQEKSNGYTEATDVPGHPNYALGNEDSVDGRLDFLWKPSNDLTLELWGEAYENNAHGDAFKNIYDPNPDPYKVTQDYPSTTKSISDVVSAKASYDLGWATANAILSYQHGKLDAAEGLDKLDFATAIPIYGVHDVAPNNYRTGHSTTQEFDLTSKPGGKLDWIVGVFAIQQSYDETFLEYQYTDPTAVLPGDVSNAGADFATGALAFESTDTQKLNSWSAYGQGTYQFTDTLRLIAGARGTVDYQVGYVSTYFDPDVTLKAKYKALTGKIELENDFTSSTTGYAMWSSGIKPGGANLNPGALYVPEVFQPEKNDALEAGLKNQFFDHRLRLNLAAYYNYYRDFQADSEDPIPYLGGLTNIKTMDTYGFESELTALLPYNLRFDNTLTLMGGKVMSHQQMFDPEVAQEIDRANGGPFNGNDVDDRFAAFYAGSADIYGRTPPKLPPFSATFGLTHNLYLPNGDELTSHLTYSFRDAYWFRIYDNPQTDKVPVYNQWNADFKYRFAHTGWYADLILTNLMDTPSVVSKYTDNFGVGAVAEGFVPPRSFVLRVGKSF